MDGLIQTSKKGATAISGFLNLKLRKRGWPPNMAGWQSQHATAIPAGVERRGMSTQVRIGLEEQQEKETRSSSPRRVSITRILGV